MVFPETLGQPGWNFLVFLQISRNPIILYFTQFHQHIWFPRPTLSNGHLLGGVGGCRTTKRVRAQVRTSPRETRTGEISCQPVLPQFPVRLLRPR
jgi:hypothetical protein